MKKLMIPLTLVALMLSAFAGEEYPELPRKLTDETPTQKEARLAWWRHDRFGMFIHFGLYSALGRHEWVKSRETIADAAYDEHVKYFNPDLFDARDWARRAKAAGMKYVVLTTKHHEGFCMWDTKTTDYKITKTPFGRDLVREYVDALRAEGLRVGFYFSIIDWHHPDYTIDFTHPRRPGPDRNQATKEAYDKLNEGRDMNRYRAYMFEQVRELLTDYGKIDIIWFDYTPKHDKWFGGKTYKDWNAVELLRLARRLQPSIIIDNRLDLMDTDDGWDFVTPEQFKAKNWPTVRGEKVPWETCQTFSGSWGYYRDEATWKSVPQLLELLAETVSKGGNLIMNVGPTARGRFDRRAQERLEGFARWMDLNARSIYGCTKAPDGFAAPNGTCLTYNPETNRIYIHLADYPMGFLPLDWYDQIAYAQFLHDASELAVVPPPRHHSQTGDTGAVGGISLPIVKPDVDMPVIECFLNARDSQR